MNNKILTLLITLVIIGTGTLYFLKSPIVQSDKEQISTSTNIQNETSVVETSIPSKSLNMESTTIKVNVSDNQTQSPTLIDTQESAPITSTTTNIEPEIKNETIPAKIYNVPIISFAFNPKTLTINKGDTVIWTNNDSAPHDVKGTNYGKLSSPTLSKGGQYSFTFNEIGTFDYYCSIHPMMRASIIVK